MWGEAERKLGNNCTMGEWEPLKLLIKTVIILVIKKFFSSILSFGISATRIFFIFGLMATKKMEGQMELMEELANVHG